MTVALCIKYLDGPADLCDHLMGSIPPKWGARTYLRDEGFCVTIENVDTKSDLWAKLMGFICTLRYEDWRILTMTSDGDSISGGWDSPFKVETVRVYRVV